MNDSLLHYYEQELQVARRLAREFAEAYPDRAGRLGLHAPETRDPHVERLIEAFALLTGRVRGKLDDEFPELTDALLGVLYPHYLSPLPALGVVQFDVDPARGDLTNGFTIPRHSRLATPPVPYEPGKAAPCLFRTCYPVNLWPVALAEAWLRPPPFPPGLEPPPGTKAVLQLRLATLGGARFADLGPDTFDRLRFYLYGDSRLVGMLYEVLFNRVLGVRFGPAAHEPGQAFTLAPEECLFPVGFERHEGVLDYPPQSFLGYRLLTEFFAFPSKFFFLDLGGWARARRAGFGRAADVTFFLQKAEPDLTAEVRPQTFRLGCAPIVNLFDKQLADPIPLTQLRHEYHVLPDANHRAAMEVYSVDEVSHTDPSTGQKAEYQPFYSFRHGQSSRRQKTFWYASRRPALQAHGGSEVYLHLVDLDFTPHLPRAPVLHVRTTCTNRRLARFLQQQGERLALEPEIAVPGLASTQCPQPPTLPDSPPLRRGAYWRLVSHLCLNHLSLAEGEEGAEALREVLRLYAFSPAGSELVEAVLGVQTRPVVRRLASAPASGVARGLEVTVRWDRQRCLGTGVYLFACVLERFLGLYASVNSFSQLVGKTTQENEEPFKTWPPRAGEQQLL